MNDLENLYLKMEEYARINKVPIIEKSGLDTLLELLEEIKPNKILEVGTAIGYSALKMNERTSANITTFERDSKMLAEAKKNIKLSGKEEFINIIDDDLLKIDDYVLEKLGIFDVIYIDGAKAQYYNFFKKLKFNINENTIILLDNMNFHGYVYNEEKKKELRKNKYSLVSKIEKNIQKFSNEKDYDFEILDNGDGIGLLKRKRYE